MSNSTAVVKASVRGNPHPEALSLSVPFQSENAGTVDIQDGTAAGTTKTIPFGAVDVEGQALVIENDSGQDLVLKLNGSASLFRMADGARVMYASPRLRRGAMTGSPTLTFAEVGGTGDTITRSAGSFIDDGFVAGDLITIAGAVNGQNNLAAVAIASLTDTVITLGSDDLLAEVATASCTMVSAPATAAKLLSASVVTTVDQVGDGTVRFVVLGDAAA